MGAGVGVWPPRGGQVPGLGWAWGHPVTGTSRCLCQHAVGPGTGSASSRQALGCSEGTAGCSGAPLRPTPRSKGASGPPPAPPSTRFPQALSVGTLAWGQHFGDTGTMYGNLESSQAGQGQVSVLGPGREEENLYEPLDPTSTVPGQKHVPDPGTPWARARASSAGKTHAVFKTSGTQLCPNWEPVTTHPPSQRHGASSGKKLVLVGAAVLGVSVLMNILFLTIGSQRITALTSALEAEKEKQLSNVASRSFLLYNEDHRKCVAASGHQLIATACQPEAAAQQFQWLQGGQLQGWQSQRCVTATRGQNRAFVRLEPCRADGRLQRWECRDGGLLALAGYNLYFNYGNNQEQVVMLYTGNRQWSRWVIHGSQDNVCSRSCCPPCSKGWTYFRNSCYFYSKTPSSWEKRPAVLLGSWARSSWRWMVLRRRITSRRC
ncbi:uncharacterized protein LOC130143202 isoform X2 [Falco biarmicus]|uniref:uncharacterized protein LOC130143202 isoform X2 n=1 Tax=Falco biarmicus TaxID=345155 RepID=UPI0024BD1F86|nr:uncharacterized protein LOC130143202 isoform X2 [Falco biarmicus]